jgi:hypothetical protein
MLTSLFEEEQQEPDTKSTLLTIENFPRICGACKVHITSSSLSLLIRILDTLLFPSIAATTISISHTSSTSPALEPPDTKKAVPKQLLQACWDWITALLDIVLNSKEYEPNDYWQLAQRLGASCLSDASLDKRVFAIYIINGILQRIDALYSITKLYASVLCLHQGNR